MKADFCASEHGRGTALCTWPTQRYSNRSNLDNSRAEMYQWYCSKPGAAESAMCRRQVEAEKLKTPSLSLDERKKIYAQLRDIGPTSMTTVQAATAEFCKLNRNIDKSICIGLKSTMAMKSLQQWYCSQPAHGESLWCKRQTLLDKLRTAPVASEERKALIKELAQTSKDAASGSTSGEFAHAKAEFCRLPGKASLPLCALTKGLPSRIPTQG